ncbi:MAG: PIN domain-containing protein [Candidatus Eremiobacteraeota bacterium]|nr:PIN domain-containing protein [Candidatus Eremiobacteraeota bacterium]
MIVFCDTSALYALFSKEDAGAPHAHRVWNRLLEDGVRFVTTNYVAVETVSLLQARFGLESVRQFVEVLLSIVELRWIDAALHEAAIQRLFAANQRRVSLVDHSSFSFMTKYHITTAFSLDRDFAEHGFSLAD